MKRLLPLCLVTLLCVTACVPAGGRRMSGATLTFSGLAGEPDSLNPMLSNQSDLYNFSHLYMSYLIENDARGEAIPEIAREVPTRANGGISADLRTITYHIRRGVRWQDGAPLTARDIVFSYLAVVNPHNNVPTRVGYDQVQAIAAPNEYTVVVRLRRRFSPFVQYFFGPQGVGAIVPAHVLADRADLNRVAYNERPIGSGPFRVVQWRHGDSITLAANPLYWRGEAKIRRIVYRIIADSNTRLEQLRTGEVDAYFDVDPQLLPQARMIAGVRIAFTPVNDVHALRFNLRDPILRDPHVRRAIAMAIDRLTLIAAGTHGSGVLVNADQPRNGWAYDPAVLSIPYDPEAAKRLLKGRTFELTLGIAPAIINGSRLVASVLQEDLRRIGIGTIVKQYPAAMFYGPAVTGGILASGRYQLAYDAWWVLGNDPDDSWSFACDQFPPVGLNYSFWCDARADAAMHDALTTEGRARRKADYALVQDAIARELPIFPLWQVRIPDAYRTYVHGIAPAPFGSSFWNAWSWTIAP